MLIDAVIIKSVVRQGEAECHRRVWWGKAVYMTAARNRAHKEEQGTMQSIKNASRTHFLHAGPTSDCPFTCESMTG